MIFFRTLAIQVDAESIIHPSISNVLNLEQQQCV